MTTAIFNAETRDGVALPEQYTLNADGSYSKNIGAVGVSGVTPYGGTLTQTIITLVAATTQQLIAANPTRKGLQWMVTGVNPATVAPGVAAAVANVGLNYNGAVSGFQGGGETFEGTSVPTGAFQAISTLGTTVTVWELT